MNNNEIIQPSKHLKTSKADLSVYTFFTVLIQTFILMILAGLLNVPLLLSAILSPFIHCFIEYKYILSIVYKENRSKKEMIEVLFQKCEEYVNIIERLKFIFTLILVCIVLIPVIYVLSPFSWTSIAYTCGAAIALCLIVTYLHLPNFFALFIFLRFQKLIETNQLIHMVERNQNTNDKDKRTKQPNSSISSLSNTGIVTLLGTDHVDRHPKDLNPSLDIIKFTPQDSKHPEIDTLRAFIPRLPTQLIRPLHRIIDVMLTTYTEQSTNDDILPELKSLMIQYADKISKDLNQYLKYSNEQNLSLRNKVNQNPHEWIEDQLLLYLEEMVTVVESMYSDDIQVFLDHEKFINQRFDDKKTDFKLLK